MSILDDLPALIGDALGSTFRDGSISVPGAQTSDGQGGYTTAAATVSTCKLLVEDFSDFRRASAGIPANDRKIIILASTISPAVVPVVGWTVTAESRDWQIIAVVRDPAAATYELQAR
jgi:hypothetical protein